MATTPQALTERLVRPESDMASISLLLMVQALATDCPCQPCQALRQLARAIVAPNGTTREAVAATAPSPLKEAPEKGGVTSQPLQPAERGQG